MQYCNELMSIWKTHAKCYGMADRIYFDCTYAHRMLFLIFFIFGFFRMSSGPQIL